MTIGTTTGYVRWLEFDGHLVLNEGSFQEEAGPETSTVNFRFTCSLPLQAASQCLVSILQAPGMHMK